MRIRTDSSLKASLVRIAGVASLLVMVSAACGKTPDGERVPAGRPGGDTEHPVATPGGQAAAPADGLERPFNPAKWDEYYRSCKQAEFADKHKSSRLRFPKSDPKISLVLVPHDAAYRGTEDDLRAGRFVGVIRNYLSGTLPEHNIEGGTANAPSTTCVWVEQVPG